MYLISLVERDRDYSRRLWLCCQVRRLVKNVSLPHAVPNLFAVIFSMEHNSFYSDSL